MNRSNRFFIIFYFLLSTLLIIPACERTVEKDVIEPIEMMVGQKSAAAAQVAVSNVQNVRAALMRYPAVSPTNEYPGDMDIYDYSTLREVLADANLPTNITELKWDAGFGISYTSDGYTFTFQAKALSGETITATPGGVSKN